MLKDITLGQYFPGKTVVHRLDPRTKLLMTILYIVALFVADSWLSYGLVLAFLVSAVAMSRIKPKTLLRGLKPIVIIVILTAILNLFYTGGEHVLVRFWGLTITWEGVRTAFFMVSRIVMLITGTFLLTYTTSPIALTDGLESLLGPLKKVRLPVHELSMMMCIALRFIPTLIEETDKIMSAQKARGADFDTGNLLQKAKALVPLLGTPVHFCLPPGRRACHCHGVPLLPRRRGPHPSAPAQAEGHRHRRPGLRGASVCGHRRAAALWTLRKKIMGF